MRGYASTSDTTGVALVTGATYDPYSGVKSVTYGNGITESFARDTDDQIVEVRLTSGATVLDDRSLTWVGAILTAINDTVLTGLSESFSYTATNRLAAASGTYGTFAWTYDAVGNRTSEQLGSVLSTYAYPTDSNRLASITPGAATARALTYVRRATFSSTAAPGRWA